MGTSLPNNDQATQGSSSQQPVSSTIDMQISQVVQNIMEGPKSNQSIIKTKLLCLVISMYVVSVNYCVQGSEAYEVLVIV